MAVLVMPRSCSGEVRFGLAMGSQLRLCRAAGSLLSGQLGPRLPALTTMSDDQERAECSSPQAPHGYSTAKNINQGQAAPGVRYRLRTAGLAPTQQQPETQEPPCPCIWGRAIDCEPQTAALSWAPCGLLKKSTSGHKSQWRLGLSGSVAAMQPCLSTWQICAVTHSVCTLVGSQGKVSGEERIGQLVSR